MGKNLRPRGKIARRLSFNIDIGVGADKKSVLTKRNYPPGVHGQKRSSRPTVFGLQLQEKQKVKAMYGVMEKQFRNYFEKALRQKGNTAENLVAMLETRLDTLVNFMQLAPTQQAARQLITHGHIFVNGKKLRVPSHHVREGDEISIRKESAEKKHIVEQLEKFDSKRLPAWITFSKDDRKGKLVGKPPFEDTQRGIQYQYIVEFYSR